MTFDNSRLDVGTPGRSTARRMVRVPDPSRIKPFLKVVGDAFAPPPAYPDELAEFVSVYRQTDKLPRVDFDKLNAKPKGTFRQFPSSYRQAIAYASPHARLVFFALWGQYEDKYARANGLLSASIEWLTEQTGIGKRNYITDAVLELEIRGIVRVMRGRGGAGKNFPNLFLLTAFPDCLGNPPTYDYEQFGLPQEKPNGNSDETRAAEARLIVERLRNRVEATMEIVRYLRKHGGRIEE